MKVLLLTALFILSSVCHAGGPVQASVEELDVPGKLDVVTTMLWIGDSHTIGDMHFNPHTMRIEIVIVTDWSTTGYITGRYFVVSRDSNHYPYTDPEVDSADTYVGSIWAPGEIFHVWVHPLNWSP